KDDGHRFWAAWSGVLVYNEAPALAAMQAFAETGGPFAAPAARTAPRRMDPASAGRWIQRLRTQPRRTRLAVLAAGAAGDPKWVPWLLDQMAVTSLARVAAESLSLITGIDLAAEHLDGPPLEGGDTGPTDNPEDAQV